MRTPDRLGQLSQEGNAESQTNLTSCHGIHDHITRCVALSQEGGHDNISVEDDQGSGQGLLMALMPALLPATFPFLDLFGARRGQHFHSTRI